LALPLFFHTFFTGYQSLNKIHVTLFDIVIPIFVGYTTMTRWKIITDYIKSHKNEALFLILVCISALVTLTKSDIEIKNFLKDFFKPCLFSMALFFYKDQFTNVEIKNSHLCSLIIVSILLLYVRYDSGTPWGHLYITPLTSYAFYLWLIVSYDREKNILLYALTTSLFLLELIILKRSELLFFSLLTSLIMALDHYKVTLKKILLSCLIVLLTTLPFFGYLYSTLYKSIHVRLNLWYLAVKTGINGFPLGIGLGQYQAQSITPKWTEDLYIPNYDTFQYPHNQFLYWFAENGVIGLLLGIAFIYIISRHLKYLAPYWKFGVFTILVLASSTHDIISFRILPIFLALIFILSKDQKPTKELP
jgi:hypothetical protein